MSDSEFTYVDQLPLAPRETRMRLLTTSGARSAQAPMPY